MRKFFFFLDPLRTGKIKIQDILASSFLDDLLELRDQDLAKDAQDANWFSAPSALRVYGQYLNLDKDHNGMLSRQVWLFLSEIYMVLDKKCPLPDQFPSSFLTVYVYLLPIQIEMPAFQRFCQMFQLRDNP